MKTKVVAVLCAVLFSLLTAPVFPQDLELGCPGSYGPVSGKLNPGLYTADLFSDRGAPVGIVETFNTSDSVHFNLIPNPDIDLTDMQLWVGKHPADIVTKKDGKPWYGKFDWVEKLKLDPGQAFTYTLTFEQLGFSWQGHGHSMGFMLHGKFVDSLDYEGDFQAMGSCMFYEKPLVTYSRVLWRHPDRGQFIDSPVVGIGYHGPTQHGITKSGDVGGGGGFLFFPDEIIEFSLDEIVLGTAVAAKKVSPLDLFHNADINDPRVIDVARILQTLDSNRSDGKITLLPSVVGCFNDVAMDLGLVQADYTLAYGDESLDMDNLLDQTVLNCSQYAGEDGLVAVAPDEAQGNLEAGLNASGIFRKNVSKTEDWGETKQKLEVMPVYFPGLRSNGDPSLCVDVNGDKLYDEGEDTIGVPYEEWRLGGDPLAEECDPRDYEDAETCVVTLIECRDLAKPILTTYMAKVDIFDDQVKEEFWPGRFAWDLFTAVSRDDGTTWKRRNVSRMADMSSFDLETGEPFPGTVGSPYLKVNDNKILTVWESKFCKSGNPRYSINLCDDPATEEVEWDDPATVDVNECAIYCRGGEGHEVCEPDYPGDDAYYVTDIWGVRGSQGSVDYDEVDDVAELGIGEIPYSCLWAARGVIATQKDLDEGTFASMNVEDDPLTDVTQCTAEGVPFECCTGLDTGSCDESAAVGLGDIVWFKPERITSGRRDVYIPMVGSARGAGFAIAWQEDPSGLRPGKGKGPGEGWSGAITNHKSDMWYSFIAYDDFNIVDETFVPGGPGSDDPTGEEGFLDKPGLGRPKALVPFSLPVRVTDNDMVNTHTLKVEPSTACPTFPDSTGENEAICFPEVVDGSFVPIDPEEIAAEFCGHPDADPATCCDPENHEGDPNCEDLKGLFGNSTGTKRYAYLARSIDEVDNATGLYLAGGDGIPDYQYYEDRGGTLDLCDLSAANSFFAEMPGTSAHERWFGFTNTNGVDKLVCVASDGRLLDGDVYASRPMLQLQPYTKADGTKSAWALLAYEESKGLGHSLAMEAHDDNDNPVDPIIAPEEDDKGQEKPIKQDIGKNMIYHSFDFTQPDLVAPGHIANLPALCGGLYPTYCDDRKTPDIIETNEANPTCTCEAGQPVPLYFDYFVEGTDPDTGEVTGEWIPDETKFLQFRYEIARRARFLMQSPGKMGDTKTLGALIYKQGQEGQGRPADAYIRRFVKSGTGNPYKFENMECTTYLDETFDLPGCPTDGVAGYNCNVWGEASGDRLCGGINTDGDYPRRDHINLTSHDVDLAVGVGPEDDTPDDPTDDVYNRHKVLLWSQHERNLGDESYGLVHEDGTPCDVLNGEVCPGMYSNVRSHRGFIRGDFFAVAYAMSPNWAAGRNGNDRYNFYVRKSFDGGQTWTTDPDGSGVYVCPEFRTDPYSPDPDGSGNMPPAVFDETCGYYDPDAVPDGELPPQPVGIAMTHYDFTLNPLETTIEGLPAQFIAAGAFEPARNVSEIKSNHESSGDPRLGTTPPTYPLDGTSSTLAKLCPDSDCVYTEDTYENNMFFVAWGTVDNEKSTGSSGVKAESGPLDLYYTRSEDYGDNYVKIPWEVGGANSSAGFGETVWRYDFVAKGEPEEQGECQLRATSDGSKAYVIWHSTISDEEDPDVPYTRYYPWKPSGSSENDIWFRRLIFWPDAVEPVIE
ncbi:MAG: hypothetical protein KJO80_01780 [Gammaproteobacteria bacterium]|nr:hypothetical protein [Gammaproteobacteria bacterium]